MKDYLAHHGIKGQTWGERNGPPYPLKRRDDIRRMADENLKHATKRNLDAWGADANHNVCYISGVSGSGKTTVAQALRGEYDDVIHLDGYSESKKHLRSTQSKRFNDFLKSKGITVSDLYGDKRKRNSKEYWDLVDSFAKAIEEYGRLEFKNGRRVIVEGVEITNGWLFASELPDDAPYIHLNMNAQEAHARAVKRDSRR